MLACASPSQAGNIVWRADTGRFDARVQDGRLQEILGEVASQTGWHVYWDSNLQATVRCSFSNLPPQEALGRLFGNLSFSLLPRTNAPAKLSVYQGSAARATERVLPAESATNPAAITNELILRLKAGSSVDVHALASRLGAKVTGRVDELGAYRLHFDNQDAAQKARSELASMEDIASVESNYALVPPSRVQEMPGNLPPLNLKPAGGSGGGSVVVALLDTPLTANHALPKDFLLPGVSVTESATISGSSPTEFSHGQAMAETILRALATQSGSADSTVRILPVDIYGGQATTTTFDIVRGLYAAAPSNPSVVNLSLAGPGESPLLHDAVKAFTDRGVLVFAASGNDPTTAPMYPAAYSEAVAVTAGDRNGQLSSYANRGDFVDLLAPGTGVVQVGNQAFLVNGTSTATANVSGVAAGLLERKGATSEAVLAALRRAFPFQATASPGASTAPTSAPGTH